MISSVSNINFRGNEAIAPNQDLINAPGKFSAPVASEPDTFEKAEEGHKKSKAPAVIGGLIGAAALIYAGLGLAVGKGKLTKATGEGFVAKIQNFFHSIGKNAENMYNKVFNREAAKAAD